MVLEVRLKMSGLIPAVMSARTQSTVQFHLTTLLIHWNR